MVRFVLLTVSLMGLALFGVAAADSPGAVIKSAAVAPYRDELLRDAAALCSDLIQPPTIVPSAPPGASCEQAVQSVFAAADPLSISREVALSLRASARHLEIHGHHATGIFSLSAIEPTMGTPSAARVVALGRYQLELEETAGRWLVSSPARLAAVGDCQLNPHGHCQPNVKRLLFILGVPVGPTPEEAIPTPAAVRRASSRERREFTAGRTVFVHTGCLACHKIGGEGNSGPGQNLTRVGAQLSSPQIEHAILSPRAPMPSFKNLPARKLRNLVRFLSLMR
jgi:hypothetical protein